MQHRATTASTIWVQPITIPAVAMPSPEARGGTARVSARAAYPIHSATTLARIGIPETPECPRSDSRWRAYWLEARCTEYWAAGSKSPCDFLLMQGTHKMATRLRVKPYFVVLFASLCFFRPSSSIEQIKSFDTSSILLLSIWAFFCGKYRAVFLAKVEIR